MQTKRMIYFILAIFALNASASERVRKVPVLGDQIVTVKTSMGIATIIQVPDRPNSVVVGDQDAFKVEYLDQAITIKPLSGTAKSNLYIYTDWKRFNVQLVSGHESIADYVVYLENPKEKITPKSLGGRYDSGIRWTGLRNTLRNEEITLIVKRVGRNRKGILVAEFSISSQKKEAFKPEWIWITQNGETKPIHNLFMSSLEVSPHQAILGALQMREIDLNANDPIRVELRRAKTSYLTLTKVTSWMR